MAGAELRAQPHLHEPDQELDSQLRGKGCAVVGSDQRLQIMSGSAFVYPDLTVVCGTPEFNEDKQA